MTIEEKYNKIQELDPFSTVSAFEKDHQVLDRELERLGFEEIPLEKGTPTLDISVVLNEEVYRLLEKYDVQLTSEALVEFKSDLDGESKRFYFQSLHNSRNNERGFTRPRETYSPVVSRGDNRKQNPRNTFCGSRGKSSYL